MVLRLLKTWQAWKIFGGGLTFYDFDVGESLGFSHKGYKGDPGHLRHLLQHPQWQKIVPLISRWCSASTSFLPGYRSK